MDTIFRKSPPPPPHPPHPMSSLHFHPARENIPIYVPVVFMARYAMILRGATSLRGALEGVGPENRDFFGP
jgi:hypothetical protein